MQTTVEANLLRGSKRRGVKGVIVLALLALLASPGPSRGAEPEPSPRKHVLSGGVGVTLGGLGGRYLFRWNERGPVVAAGAGLLGYGLELGVPIHRSRSKPTRELFLYGGMLRVEMLSDLDLTSKNEGGSHIWVIGVGPRLWPDPDNKVYVGGAGELMLSNEADRWWSLAFEAGVGF